MPAKELAGVLDALQTAMEADDVPAIHSVLKRSVEGYRPELRQPVETSKARSRPTSDRDLNVARGPHRRLLAAPAGHAGARRDPKRN